MRVRGMHARSWAGVARTAIVAALTAGLLAGCSGSDGDSPSAETGYPKDATLRLDQTQVLASHNSYHGRPDQAVINTLGADGLGLTLDYAHLPIDQELDLGVRAIELDVYDDPQGGKYANSDFLAGLGLPQPDQPEMRAPGFKVIHEAGIDTNSTCRTFVACLQIVEAWSEAHPGHVPIGIQIEMKDDAVTEDTFGRLEREISTNLARDDYFVPDDVRAGAPTLGEAVRTKGWPVLGDVRGKVYFLLDNGGLRTQYLTGHPSLEGRLIFTPSSPGQPDAAFAKLNDPVDDTAEIDAAIAANMMVRTRSDADTFQARSNDTSQAQAALGSGAQIVSTDYERADPKLGTGYVVAIPGGTPARCNPRNAPADCTSADVENPAFLARR